MSTEVFPSGLSQGAEGKADDFLPHGFSYPDLFPAPFL